MRSDKKAARDSDSERGKNQELPDERDRCRTEPDDTVDAPRYEMLTEGFDPDKLEKED